MSSQITKQDNFIKINVTENTSWEEFCRCIKEFDESLLSKFYYVILCNKEWTINDKVIYLICSNNSCYTIYTKENEIFIHKRTIYDEKNPNIYENCIINIDEEDLDEFDKKFHVDDMLIIIDTIAQEYAIQNLKHGLFHGSTFYGPLFNSKYVKDFNDRVTKRMLLNKKFLLEMAQELIEEIKNIENIETIIDLKALEVIPLPDEIKRLTNTKKYL